MARVLRMERAGAWYHLTVRGNERRLIFRDDRDRRHFLELFPPWLERFDCRLHAYVLMDNHYHLLLQTREANLSRAMQWLNVSYSVWFNRRHQRVGHLFQGRFKSVIVEPETWALGLSRYVHLNSVRIGRLGLNKAEQRLRRMGAGSPPSPELVAQRLAALRQFPWSSYRSYAGYMKAPEWLSIQTVLSFGGGPVAERKRRYRGYAESAIREGFAERPWQELVGRLALGSREFVERLVSRSEAPPAEQQWAQAVRSRPTWAQVVAVVERMKRQNWEEFRNRHCDWGRELALFLGREKAGLKLAELAVAAGSATVSAVSMALKRFGARLATDASLRQLVAQARQQLCNVIT